MTTEECYKKLGGNYAEIRERLFNDNLIKKFLDKFTKDDSYANLCSAFKEGNPELAYRAVHTLKGVCQNLGLGALLVPVVTLTELLRHEKDAIPPEGVILLEKITVEYNNTISTILEYLK